EGGTAEMDLGHLPRPRTSPAQRHSSAQTLVAGSSLPHPDIVSCPDVWANYSRAVSGTLQIRSLRLELKEALDHLVRDPNERCPRRRRLRPPSEADLGVHVTEQDHVEARPIGPGQPIDQWADRQTQRRQPLEVRSEGLTREVQLIVPEEP